MPEEIKNSQQLNLFNETVAPDSSPCKECGKEIGEGGTEEYCANCVENCASCNEKIRPKDGQYGPDGKVYCDTCYGDEFLVCPNCDKTIENSEYLSPGRRQRSDCARGGCTYCCLKCNNCDRIFDKVDANEVDGSNYCDQCFSDNFFPCDGCGEITDLDDGCNYVEDQGNYCDQCFSDNFFYCEGCQETMPLNQGHETSDGTILCDDCYDHSDRAAIEYPEHIKDFTQTDYTKKDRFIQQLNKLLPISVKDLKDKHPSLSDGLRDLIIFSKGKTLTREIIAQYRASISPEIFPINYTTYTGRLGQRSIKRSKDKANLPLNKGQLVVNIIASQDMLSKMKANPTLYDLFDSINNVSKQSSHPYVKDQIGWARLEIDPSNNFVLVDEIQSDHNNAAYQLRSGNNVELENIKISLKNKYSLDDTALQKLLSDYSAILKDFTNIATETVAKFARKNNIKKIYWHTYEGGRSLKNNDPPRSIYTTTPKEHFYEPSADKPFGLDAEFFEREAQRAHSLVKLARRIYLKSMGHRRI